MIPGENMEWHMSLVQQPCLYLLLTATVRVIVLGSSSAVQVIDSASNHTEVYVDTLYFCFVIVVQWLKHSLVHQGSI